MYDSYKMRSQHFQFFLACMPINRAAVNALVIYIIPVRLNASWAYFLYYGLVIKTVIVFVCGCDVRELPAS
jgi:hypothetical protein